MINLRQFLRTNKLYLPTGEEVLFTIDVTTSKSHLFYFNSNKNWIKFYLDRSRNNLLFGGIASTSEVQILLDNIVSLEHREEISILDEMMKQNPTVYSNYDSNNYIADLYTKEVLESYSERLGTNLLF